MLHVGARRMTADFNFASAARNWPTCWTSSSLKVDAKDVAHCRRLLKIKPMAGEAYRNALGRGSSKVRGPSDALVFG
jgi:hypothetical protein